MLKKIRNIGIAMIIGFVPFLVTMGTAEANVNNGKIDQGETIFTLGHQCTVGYIDHHASRVYTAGHCGQNGASVLVKEENYLNIGTFNTNYNWDIHRNDFGWIDVPRHFLGQNKYSGNNIATNISRGDKICSYGSYSNKTYCGVVRGQDGNLVLSGAGGIPGDSGGPAWIPGKGFVGVYSVYWSQNRNIIATGFNTINNHDPNTKWPEPLVDDPIIIEQNNIRQLSH